MAESIVKELQITIDDPGSVDYTWKITSVKEPYLTWHVFRDCVYLGFACWRPDRLSWEPVPNGGEQPSDTMLKVLHMLIGESFEVPRTA